MFSTLNNKIIALVFGLLVVSVLAFGVFFKINQGQIALLKSDLARSEQSKKILQNDLTSVSNSLEVAEKDKENLLNSLSLLAKALSDRERDRNAIKQGFAASNKELKQIFNGASDEKTKSWGAADIPADLNRVLERSARCANSYRHQDSLCFPAKGTDQQVPSAAIFQQEKPRAF
ncbi:conserved hypothetical protein [Shewanella sp. W3-18-1]|uniref:hypothetical protein n=1 Tax=Shewanella sp. (strain W3-18-1) TaxID=351745 RepID=UPI00005FC46D|nr:hypothetical protein [Shewanella sp. W3-18-1]ABM25312.1 conserved hypothetical protein [Shewanella sp. W3-18-1]